MRHVWSEVRLGDVCRVVTGFAFKSRDWSSEGVPVVKIKNIKGDGTVDLSEVDHIPNNLVSANLSKFILTDGDILIAMTGATAGKVGRLEADGPVLLNQRVAKIKPIRVDPTYLWAVVSSNDYERIFFRLADGAAQPNMSGNQIEGVLIPAPPIDIQRRIGVILGAYDDLIDVNRRRIALLEKMARRLFEEWFVYFRFPSHEGHPLVSARETQVPKGWRIARLDEVAAINADTLRTANAPARIGYVDISSVTLGTIEKVDWMAFANAPGRARRRVKDGSIIWSMVRPNRRSYALVLDPAEDTIVSTGFAVLDPQAVPVAYLFHAVTTNDFVGYLTGNATGAAYPAVTGAVFDRASIVVPPSDLTSRFAATVDPMLRVAAKLKEANSKLAASRVLLLPKLVSGELTVEAAECGLEVAA